MMYSLRALDDLRSLFQALDGSPDPVYVTDRHGRIVFWNESTRHVLGFSSDEAVGKSCCELLEGCDAFGNRYCSPTCPIMQMATRDEIVHQFDLRLRARDHRAVRVDVDILQLKGETPGDFFLAHILRPVEEAQLRVIHGPEQTGPPPQAVAARDSTDARVRKLTAREVEILAMLAAGRNTPEIAERLHISRVTARNHIQNILDKLEIHSKAEAVALAFQKKLL
ncbi:MAG TPA: LuxR C-terminal-related transcriptional regulator [Thermoanaerobaculia bacterium]|nr:LuxR C-terminal-related transcriptional regulator [Thermoanaerobaculia bacterium]